MQTSSHLGNATDSVQLLVRSIIKDGVTISKFMIAAEIVMTNLGNEHWPAWQAIASGDFSLQPTHPWLKYLDAKEDAVMARYTSQHPNGLSCFLLFFYLIRLTYDSHAVPMLFFSFHIMLHALLTSFISVQCMAMSYFFSSILPPPCGTLMHCFVSIPWPCLLHASTSCY